MVDLVGAPDAVEQPMRADRRGLLAWASWDWGSAAFNAVVTTFVFSAYLASRAFVDPAVVARASGSSPSAAAVSAVDRALAHNATVVSIALTIAGVIVALLAPAVGRLADASGYRKRSVLVATTAVAIVIACMTLVAPAPGFLVLGAALLAAGTVAFEIASVGYNAMLAQVALPGRTGRVSGIGWAAGYFGGIVLLIVLLVTCIQSFGADSTHAGLLHLPATVAGGSWDIRVAIGIAAVWLAAFSVPLFVTIPEARPTGAAGSLFGAYADLGRDIGRLWRSRRNVLVFLIASAIFRDGLAAVFTFGAIIAAQVFGFSSSEVILFAIAANIVAGISTVFAGRLDDRFGSRALIVAALIGLCASGTGVLFIGTAQVGFWILGLALTVFVGPVQASSRAYLARLATPGREGELFGLYATTGKAASFLAPALFGLAVTLGGSTRFGILGIVVVLLAGLVLMAFVRADAASPTGCPARGEDVTRPGAPG
ncbi:MFS transporter [Curtobacterium ammoniigenes]|uniref:MFS transporter n=1 Tax=Curtobacterium ammoniigenes TaxID=395387 RepID=UPI000833048D|nr:MFS transporter [Curtobacterium ammoniigenes]